MITTAQRIAEDIHRAIQAKTGQNVEVFPHNKKELRLPLHPDKITIIDRLLPKAVRQKGYERQKFETHSVLAFMDWLNGGEQYDEHLLLRLLLNACDNLDDDHAAWEEQQSDFGRLRSNGVKKARSRIGGTPSLKQLRREPDSRKRQHQALLILCRRARRVVSTDEALDFIETNQLYTGDWHDGLGKRRVRVRGILRFIDNTFDPAMTGTGEAFQLNLGKYRRWSKQEFPSGGRLVKVNRRVDEYGGVHETKRYVRFTPEDVAVFMVVQEFCRDNARYEDGGVPLDRVEPMWNLLHADGQVSRPFNHERWRLIRDRLKQRGVITVDEVWYRRGENDEYPEGKALCYGQGRWYPGRRPVWRRISKAGLPGSYREMENNTRGEGHNSDCVEHSPKMSICGAPTHERGPP